MQQDYKQQVISFFNKRTAYDSEGKNHPQEAKRLLEYVTLQPQQTILDLATGTGLVAIPAAKIVDPGLVIGVDISPGMLSQAQVKAVTAKLSNLELIEADIEQTSFSDEQFDLIFCCSALVYVSNIPAILNKCYRWLKPKGYLAFTTPKQESWLADLKVKVCRDLFKIDLPHIIRPLWTPEKCRTALQESGFRDIEIKQHQYGKSKISQNDGAVRLENEFYPRGNPLSQLSSRQLALLQTEYQKAVEELVKNRGEWLENFNLYVKAKK